MRKLIESNHVSLGARRQHRQVRERSARRTLMEHGLIDEFHLMMTPVAVGRGQHLFEDLEGAPALKLVDVTRFASGVVTLVYTPN